MKVNKKSGTKERLFEMMEKVNKIKLTESSVPKGTTVAIRDVSPDTIPVGESLPSLDMADASTKMLTPSHITDWKNEFISKFGEEGQLIKGLTLDWNWDITGNELFLNWRNKGIEGKARGIDQDKQSGFNLD